MNPKTSKKKKYLWKKLVNKEQQEGFNNRQVYIWYIGRGHILLRFLCKISRFNSKYFCKCLLCKARDNSNKHLFNLCKFTNTLRANFINKCSKCEYYPTNGLMNIFPKPLLKRSLKKWTWWVIYKEWKNVVLGNWLRYKVKRKGLLSIFLLQILSLILSNNCNK